MKGARPCCLLTRDAAGGSFPTICVLCRVWVEGLSCCLKFGPRFLGNRLPLLPLEWRRELGVTMFLPIQDRTWDQLVRKPLTRFCWENGGHLVWGGGGLYLLYLFFWPCIQFWTNSPPPPPLTGASQVVKNSTADTRDIRDVGSIPGLRRSPEVGNGNPLQCSCLENPMDRGAWQATIHGVTKSQTWLKRLSTTAQPPHPLHPSLPLICYGAISK